MNKELKKELEAFTKLQVEIGKNSQDTRDDVAGKRISGMRNQIRTALEHFSDSLVTARKSGVTGTKLADFRADRTVTDALKLIDTTFSNLAFELKEIDKREAAAGDVGQKVGRILKTAKTRVAEKKGKAKTREQKAELADWQALEQTSQMAWDELTKPSRWMKDKRKDWNDLLGSKDKSIAKVLAQAPADQAARMEKEQLIQMLQPRVLNKHANTIGALADQVEKACDAARKSSGADPAAAAASLKTAATSMGKLKTLYDTIDKAVGQEKKRIDISKSKDEINKQLMRILRDYEVAKKAFKSTSKDLKAVAG